MDSASEGRQVAVAPLVLGIESSCDDTACAVLDQEGRVLSSVISSQLEQHRPYGGVVPEIASRAHLENWPAVSAAALREAGCEMRDFGLVAATFGPGLVGSLLVGLSLGRAIAYALQRPFCAVHHLEGHLYSPFLELDGSPAQEPPEEFVGVVVSGGHTSLFAVDRGEIATISETRDDAMGEAFDKIGKRLGLDFPAGAAVDRLAEQAKEAPHRRFRTPRCGDSLDFSYSGLKTQTLVEIDKLRRRGVALDQVSEDAAPEDVIELLAEFRSASVRQIVDRVERYWKLEPFSVLAVSGGVAANRELRRQLHDWCERTGIELRLVDFRYSQDNAAMIAHAALLRHRRGLWDDPLDAEAQSRIAVGERRLVSARPT